MECNRVRLAGGMVALTTLLLLGGARAVGAQALNMTGTWNLEVTSEQNGTTTPTLTLQQDGMSLTGHYSSATLGEADVTGSVDGRTVRVVFDADLQGQAIELVYQGDVDDQGVWSGQLVAMEFPLGTFKATKAS